MRAFTAGHGSAVRVRFGRHNLLGRFKSAQDVGGLYAGEFRSMQRAARKHFLGPCPR